MKKRWWMLMNNNESNHSVKCCWSKDKTSEWITMTCKIVWDKQTTEFVKFDSRVHDLSTLSIHKMIELQESDDWKTHMAGFELIDDTSNAWKWSRHDWWGSVRMEIVDWWMDWNVKKRREKIWIEIELWVDEKWQSICSNLFFEKKFCNKNENSKF